MFLLNGRTRMAGFRLAIGSKRQVDGFRYSPLSKTLRLASATTSSTMHVLLADNALQLLAVLSNSASVVVVFKRLLCLPTKSPPGLNHRRGQTIPRTFKGVADHVPG